MPALRGLVEKYLRRDDATLPLSPPLSTAAAVALLVLYTAVYVVPLYVNPLTRPSPTLSRDAPSVIRARIRTVSWATLACALATFGLLIFFCGLSTTEALHQMGCWPVGLWETTRTLALTATLFAGPLFSYFVVSSGWRDWVSGEVFSDLMIDMPTWRNLVAGPVTEEVLFRAAGVPLLVAAQASHRATILLSPVVFGLAHLHHAYEFALVHPRVPKHIVALRSLFQFGFTTLFGSFATFLFVRTGSLVAVCAVHAFCNSMGVPQVWGRVQANDNDEDPDESEPTPIGWSVAYYVLLVGGAIEWYQKLWPWTESAQALVEF